MDFVSGNQAGGPQRKLISGKHSTVVIIDAETSANTSTGLLSIQFRTVGMKKFKQLKDPDSGVNVTIDMQNPYPIVLSDVVFEELQFTPSGFGTLETFSISIHTKE